MVSYCTRGIFITCIHFVLSVMTIFTVLKYLTHYNLQFYLVDWPTSFLDLSPDYRHVGLIARHDRSWLGVLRFHGWELQGLHSRIIHPLPCTHLTTPTTPSGVCSSSTDFQISVRTWKCRTLMQSPYLFESFES